MVRVGVAWLVGALAWRPICVSLGRGPRCILSFSWSTLGPSILLAFAAAGYDWCFLAVACIVCASVRGHTTSCSSCALGRVVCAFCGGGVLSAGVWFPPHVSVRVLLIRSLLVVWTAH